MKKLLLFSLLLSPMLATAQTVFAPAGAEWWYELHALGGATGYVHARVMGDSVVGGYTARKMVLEDVTDDTGTGTSYSTQPYATYFVRTAGEQVLRWNVVSGSYDVELDFGRSVGATWTLPGCVPNTQLTCVVDSIGQVQFGVTTLKLQYSSLQTTAGGFAAACSVQERIGARGTILFPAAICGPGAPEFHWTLIYYNDGLVRTGSAPPLGRAEATATASLRFAPNPSTNGRFQLEGLADKVVRYALFDSQGRRIRTGRLTAATSSLDLSSEAAGLYLLRGEVNGQTFTRRLVRE